MVKGALEVPEEREPGFKDLKPHVQSLLMHVLTDRLHQERQRYQIKSTLELPGACGEEDEVMSALSGREDHEE